MQATRQVILDYLREHGEGSVRALSVHLQLTATGVRQHLTILEREGLVASHEVRGRVGRPALIYRLTDQAEALYPKAYDRMARALLAAASRTLPAAAQQALLEAAAEELAAPHLPELEGLSAEERLEAACALLREQQVVVAWERDGAAFELHESTCPFREVAWEEPSTCEMERALLRRLTGMEVELCCSQARGDGDCRFRLVPLESLAGSAADPRGLSAPPSSPDP